MERWIMYDLFIMAELGVLKKFEVAFLKQNNSSEEYSGIMGSFTWASSAEKSKFWIEVRDNMCKLRRDRF